MRNLARLTVYLLFASVVSGVVLGPYLFGAGDLTLTIDLVPAIGLLFFYGGLMALPGLAIWLTILARTPAYWTPASRRLTAVVTAPLVGAYWLWLFTTGEAYLGAFVFGLLWPLGAGFVVRLRDHRSGTNGPGRAAGRAGTD